MGIHKFGNILSSQKINCEVTGNKPPRSRDPVILIDASSILYTAYQKLYGQESIKTNGTEHKLEPVSLIEDFVVTMAKQINLNAIETHNIVLREFVKIFCEDLQSVMDMFIDNAEEGSVPYFYLYYDGIPPLAKVLQQKKRRVNRGDNIIVDKDSNIIVSTAFFIPCKYMESFTDSVKIFFTNKQESKEFDRNHVVFLDNILRHGEAEHKITRRIRMLEEEKKNPKDHRTYFVYGNDNDYFPLLWMLNITPGTKLYYVVKKKDICYYNIRDTGNALVEKIKSNHMELFNEGGNISATSDLIKQGMLTDIMCLLLFCGNDFIPALPCVSVHLTYTASNETNIVDFFNEITKAYLKFKIENAASNVCNKKGEINLDALNAVIAHYVPNERVYSTTANGPVPMSDEFNQQYLNQYRIDIGLVPYEIESLLDPELNLEVTYGFMLATEYIRVMNWVMKYYLNDITGKDDYSPVYPSSFSVPSIKYFQLACKIYAEKYKMPLGLTQAETTVFLTNTQHQLIVLPYSLHKIFNLNILDYPMLINTCYSSVGRIEISDVMFLDYFPPSYLSRKAAMFGTRKDPDGTNKKTTEIIFETDAKKTAVKSNVKFGY